MRKTEMHLEYCFNIEHFMLTGKFIGNGIRIILMIKYFHQTCVYSDAGSEEMQKIFKD